MNNLKKDDSLVKSSQIWTPILSEIKSIIINIQQKVYWIIDLNLVECVWKEFMWRTWLSYGLVFAMWHWYVVNY